MALQPAAVEGFTSKISKKSEKKVNFGKSNCTTAGDHTRFVTHDYIDHT